VTRALRVVAILFEAYDPGPDPALNVSVIHTAWTI
jgi:hypothetical protein